MCFSYNLQTKITVQVKYLDLGIYTLKMYIDF